MKTERIVAVLLIIGIILFLSGCANLKLQWSASYQTDNMAADLNRMQSPARAEADHEATAGKSKWAIGK